MSKQSTVRHINQTRILTRMVELGALSRADLARELNLMRSTTGSLVAHLLKDGMIREKVDEDSSKIVGRPSVKFELNPNHGFFVIFDIDPHQSEISIFDFALNWRCRKSVESDDLHQNPKEFAKALFNILEQTFDEEGLAITDILSSLMILPALINRDGLVGYAPSLGWQNVPFKDMFYEQSKNAFPVILENDANALALCEIAQSEKAENNNIYFWLDDGVGGSVVFKNMLIRGHDGFAGEFGHVHSTALVHNPNLPLKESVENIIGRTGLIFQHQRNGGKEKNFDEFLDALSREDHIAKKTFEKWCITVAQTLGSIVGILNPEKAVFGGPLSVLAVLGKEKIKQYMDDYVLMTEAIPKIVISEAGPDEISLGCAHMRRHAYININRDAFLANT